MHKMACFMVLFEPDVLGNIDSLELCCWVSDVDAVSNLSESCLYILTLDMTYNSLLLL